MDDVFLFTGNFNFTFYFSSLVVISTDELDDPPVMCFNDLCVVLFSTISSSF